MPMASKYEHNSYLNIYSYFCKKQAKMVKSDEEKKALPNHTGQLRMSQSHAMKTEQLSANMVQMYRTGLEL